MDKGGLNFQLVDPSTWVEQARFALVSDWTGLSKWQSVHCVADESKSVATVESGFSEKSDSSDGQLAKATTRSTFATNDDLTKISGCWPSIEKSSQSKWYPFIR